MPKVRVSYHGYSVDESFFERIDSEPKAYWLGFLSADGTIGNNFISLKLTASDRDHLEKFKRALQSDHRITEESSSLSWTNKDGQEKIGEYHSVKVHIGSQRLRKSLIKLGVTPRKTWTITPCNEIPENMLIHYWRGVFDGDGSISHPKPTQSQRIMPWEINIVGNEAMIRGFASFIRKEVSTRAQPRRHRGNMWMFRVGGTRLCQQILHLLYDRSHECLSRKRALADQVFETEILRKSRAELKLDELLILRRKYSSWNQLAKSLDMGSGQLFNTLKRLGLSAESITRLGGEAGWHAQERNKIGATSG
jgi:hypothetical protein